MTYTETDLVATIENLTGADLAALTQSQRDQFDQFHSGGSEAVDRLLPGLHLAPGMTVLDVGSGFGGPARQIARSTGCSVVGVDITAAYVDAAEALTRSAGLEGQVSYICSDVAALDRTDFDAAYTMHVQMNVADKKTFFTDIAQRLRPGARFAVFEVCRTGDTPPNP
ncbi:MAG TPA: methyltransferase domain-containing protein, partial [Jatrophihabitantaceae bacterium]|nr:methyltransferase domain-containing protein [Jatrophihabitantaceae bacterium]